MTLSDVRTGEPVAEVSQANTGLVARDLPPGRFVTFAAVRLTPGASDLALLSVEYLNGD